VTSSLPGLSVQPSTRLNQVRTTVGLLREHRVQSVKFLGCAIGQAGCRAGTLWLIKQFLQHILTAPAGPPSVRLYLAAGAIFLLWFLASALEYGSKIAQQNLVRGIEFSAMMKVVRHLLTLSVRFFDRTSHGDLLTIARGDIASLRDLVGNVCTIAVSACTFTALMVTAFKLSPWLAFWGLVVFPIVTGPLIVLGNRIRRVAESRRTVGYKIYDVLAQVFNGIRLIKVYQGEQGEIESCERLGTVYYRHLLAAMQARALAGVILETLAGFGVVLVVILGGFSVIGGHIQWATLLTMLMVLMSMHDPLRQSIHAQASLKELVPSLSRLTELFETTSEVQDAPGAKPLAEPMRRLAFDHVRFAYGSNEVIKDVSFDITAGETIGLVGPSGAGKTTLLNLVPRFFDPTQGRLAINGIDLRQIPLDDLMRHISIVTQDPFLFDGTIRQNILYGRPNAREKDVQRAAEAANVHDDIMSLPRGYDTVVGVGGAKLSGGQRQRVNVARALLKDAPILLLDEATSSLDSISELKVQHSIDVLMKGRTCLVIAHRLSTLRNADRIVVLNGGSIEAIGKHEELLSSSVTYRRLWEAQSRMHYSEPMEPVEEAVTTR
jgi:ATP-binding cassette, subfamily B, bacterial MsbA